MRTITRSRIAVVVAASIVLASCGGDPVDTGRSVTAPEYLAFRDQPTACGADKPSPVADLAFEAPTDADLVGVVEVAIRTSCGPIRLELDPAIAPETVNSFVFLAEQGYFDGSASHRVYPEYIVQAGDPTASGRGGPGYVLPDEFPPSGFVYTAGTVAMANGGPGTTGSQFFIMLGEAALPPQYTVIGTVVDGFDVLQAMAAVPLGQSAGDPVPTRPLESIYLERVEVVGR